VDVLVIDNGATSALPGRVADPDLTFRCRFGDWLDLAAGRTDPWRALLLRKIRPSGRLRMMVRAGKLFA
jgi:putative sterol carrier protein